MKFAVGIFVFMWLLSGVVGAALMHQLDRHHWQAVARGPITLVKGYNETPPSYPGP